VIFLMESGRNLGEAINRMKIFQPWPSQDLQGHLQKAPSTPKKKLPNIPENSSIKENGKSKGNCNRRLRLLKFRPLFVPSSFGNQSDAEKCSKGFVSVFSSDPVSVFIHNFLLLGFSQHVPFFWEIYFSFFYIE
jgi:hypothetical protein